MCDNNEVRKPEEGEGRNIWIFCFGALQKCTFLDKSGQLDM